MSVPTTTTLAEAVWAALGTVVDPELDESLVDVGFVTDVAINGGQIEIELQLPTYWCSPNFSWLMASDARAVVLAVPGVEGASVRLLGHHDAEKISDGVNQDRVFGDVFETDVDPELHDLRLDFYRKAFISRQERMLDALGDDVPVRLEDLPDTDKCHRYLEGRARLGFDMSPDSPTILDIDGNPVTDDLEEFRRSSRSLRISLDGNSVMCRTMFATRSSRESANATAVQLGKRLRERPAS